MSTMIVEVYEAFLAAGAPEDKARAAAKAMFYDQNATKGDIVKREIALKGDVAKLDKELAMARWMLGIIITGVVAILVKAFITH